MESKQKRLTLAPRTHISMALWGQLESVDSETTLKSVYRHQIQNPHRVRSIRAHGDEQVKEKIEKN